MKSLSGVQLFATPWTVAHQAPPSMGFSRQEYWNGMPLPSPGDLPDPGIETGSEADALPLEPPGKSPCGTVVKHSFYTFLIHSLQFKPEIDICSTLSNFPWLPI